MHGPLNVKHFEMHVETCAKQSLECSLEGSSEMEKLPSKNSVCAQ